MSEISSSIRIEDGFTEPLKELAKASWDVESAVTAVAKSLVEQSKEIESVSEKAKDLGSTFAENFGEHMFLNMDKTIEATKVLADTTKHAFTDFYALSDLGAKTAFNMTKWSFGAPIRELTKESKTLVNGSFWGSLATMRWDTINKVSMAAFHKMKDSYIKGFNALMASIQKSMDEINVTDKLVGMFGDAGEVARSRAYELANEIGENATMVSELAAKASFEGIGTAHFERMMRLADKVSKLRPGESTENVANSLISNIKSGHDASSIAQMFGGGQKMERQLINAGYERALNRGDVDKALEIAEKIAVQAGLTDEKYKQATDNLSNNYKKIMNTLDNVQRRLAESFNRAFGPTVKKIKELFESNKFKIFVNFADWLIGKVGKFLNWFTETAVDNIHMIGVFLGIGIVSKVMFLLPKIKFAIKLLAMSKGPIGFILRSLGKVIGNLVAIIAKQGIIALKSKAITAIKVAGPWLALVAAIGGAFYALYKLSGTTKSFSEFLLGSIAGGAKLLMNVFQNIFTWFEHVFDYIKNMPRLWGGALDVMDDKVYELINGKKKPVITITDATGTKRMGKTSSERLEDILTEIREGQTEYVDAMDGVMAEFESGGAGLAEQFKKMFPFLADIKDAIFGTETNTGSLVRMGEQEEELKWMKAFSDRQIMSSYNSMTSNSRTVNINGMSQTSLAEMGRRNLSTIPSRALL